MAQPSRDLVWKARLSPDEACTWHYYLTAQDSNGSDSTSPYSFTVTSSTNKGFIRTSKTDARYFEYSDGTYFPGLGYNMNFDQLSWNNPILDNQANFQIMGQNGIQLIRIWLSQWSVFGAAWSPWRWINANPNEDNPYLVGTTYYPGDDVSLKLMQDDNPCMSEGHWLSAPIAVKPQTNYRVSVRAKTLFFPVRGYQASRMVSSPRFPPRMTGGFGAMATTVMILVSG